MATNNSINAPFQFTVPQGGTGSSTFTSSAMLVGDGTNPIHSLSQLSDGQLYVGSTGVDPVNTTLTPGVGINITNSPGSIQIDATNFGLSWNNVTGTSQAMAVNNGYVTNNASVVVLSLPASFNVGEIIQIQGSGAGGWSVSQNSGQTINMGNIATTTGVSGILASSQRYDGVTLIGVVANTTLAICAAQGNPTLN